MLVHDLRPISSHKLDCEVVERSNLTLEPNSVRQKDSDFHSVIAEVLQEKVLETCSALCGQFPAPERGSLHQSRPPLSKELGYEPKVLSSTIKVPAE